MTQQSKGHTWIRSNFQRLWQVPADTYGGRGDALLEYRMSYHQYVRGPTIQAVGLNFVRAAGQPATSPCQNQWRSEMLGQTILNVDASFFEVEFTGSCDAVIRDHSGAFFGNDNNKIVACSRCHFSGDRDTI